PGPSRPVAAGPRLGCVRPPCRWLADAAVVANALRAYPLATWQAGRLPRRRQDRRGCPGPSQSRSVAALVPAVALATARATLGRPRWHRHAARPRAPAGELSPSRRGAE